jgi:hypothetical protein
MSTLNDIRSYLSAHSSGAINHPSSHFDSLLADCWSQFSGADGGMSGDKLIGRMESVKWNFPHLTFTIERHGGAVMGSTRAELQHWAVNIDDATVKLDSVGHRQLYPTAERVYVAGIAADIVQQILSADDPDHLKWEEDGSVHVIMGRLFPSSSGFDQTVQGRRRRLRKALEEQLDPHGWIHVGQNRFEMNA